MSRSTVRRRWVAKHGPLPRDQYLCHRCDEPRCVNEDHIFVGTQADNIRDAMEKGRMSPPPSHLGFRRSPETRAKIAAAARRRWREGGKAAFGLERT